MTIAMADSITPADLPPGFAAYGGYDNGNWPDFQAIAAAHGGAHLLDFTVSFKNLGTGGDFEPGDMDPSGVVAWVRERLAAGVWRPVVYASIDGYMRQIVANLTAAGIARSSYRLLSAHYGVGKHICGPATCGSPVQCDGTQWIDHGSWDESILADDFFDAPVPSPTPTPSPSPSHPTTVPEELFAMLASDPGFAVRFLFRTCLHREADPGGYTTYVNALNGGQSLDWVMAQMQDSPEGKAVLVAERKALGL